MCAFYNKDVSFPHSLVSCNQFILQSAAKAGCSVCICAFALAHVPVCLCMHYSLHFLCVLALSVITTAELCLSKYWDIYVSVNLLCLIIGLGVWVKFLCVCACNCLNISSMGRQR